MALNIKIIKGRAIPHSSPCRSRKKGRHRRWLTVLKSMKDGDSFDVDVAESAAIAACAHRANIQIVRRLLTPARVGIWRKG